ncbi:MAG: DUF5696 domain-containing protein [Tepidisphaeraceae bacterium]
MKPCPCLAFVVVTVAAAVLSLDVEARAQQHPIPASRPTTTQVLSRADWGAPIVDVTRDGELWIIAGKKQRVTLNPKDLSMSIRSGETTWSMVPSARSDMLVRSQGETFPARLADAGKIDVTPYDTGYKTGVKLVLNDWKHNDKPLDATLYLTIALEGKDEELVCDAHADERGDTSVRQLDWPTALDGAAIDHTLLSNHRGVLLPRTWPKPHFPIRSTDMGGNAKVTDTSEIQSNVIESWSMSWWGFQQGQSAMMVIVETPDDAAYQFDHPAGGPTVIGPRWRPSLARFRYPRSCRMAFFPKGNYVDLAKRYRRHAIDNGTFVSLNEKIARKPIVKELIGTPLSRIGILTNITPDSLKYSTTNPSQNYRMTPFDERAKQLRAYKANGLDKLTVCLTGWPNQGYDRQHPDELPPAPIAGGWEGMKRLADTCKELGYLFSLHDQYRDYYTDAPSYDEQFAVHEEDDSRPAKGFPGSRFGQWKVGRIPFMNNWDGGVMAYMNNRLMPGHLVKNYQWLFDHGIRLDGTYLDVFGYVPPDEDFNPQHPTTRSDAIRARADCYRWARNHIGFVGTEAACDWTVPYADISSPLSSNKGIPVPLFNLVYHDAILTPYNPTDLRGYLNGGLPQLRLSPDMSAEEKSRLDRMRRLHERLALTELTNHEFLDGDKRRVERSTFSDGTKVTVDWEKNAVTIEPEIQDAVAR